MTAWSLLAVLGLGAGPTLAGTPQEDYKAYLKLGTAAGWFEFLDSHPPPDLASKAWNQLAGTLRADPRTGVRLGAMTQVTCEAGTLTIAEMVEHADVIGSKWAYYCDQGSYNWTVANPTDRTLFVRASAFGDPIEVLVAPGKAVSGSAKMKRPCGDGEHRFSRGRVTFGCREYLSLHGAGEVTTELTDFPDLLTTSDADVLRRFLAQYPDTWLAVFAKERLTAAEKAEKERFRESIRATAVAGPAPAKLIDPRPYTLVLENPHEVSVKVVVEREFGAPNPHGACPGGGFMRCSEVVIPAGGRAEIALFAEPSKEPAFKVRSVEEVVAAVPPVATPAAAAAPPAGEESPPAAPWQVAGTRWLGVGVQSNGLSWPVEMAFPDGIGIGRVGTVAYPSLKCGGTLTVKSLDAQAGRFVVREDITSGSRCVDGGSFELTVSGDDVLKFQWVYPTGKKGSTGSLKRAGTGG